MWFTRQLTRQTRVTGRGFSRVQVSQPVPQPVTTRDTDPRGLQNPCQSLERTTVNALGEVTKEEFKIDRGTNTSARITDTFSEKRVQEILEAIVIGPDLSEDQREQVRALIREYADVFALSLSEVLYVDWYKHKLNVDPNQTFPTRINQRPITEGQNEWFNNILDDMEKSYVIQKVPGDFIKSLSSTNLAPKEAGKMGITRTEVLRVYD